VIVEFPNLFSGGAGVKFCACEELEKAGEAFIYPHGNLALSPFAPCSPSGRGVGTMA